MARQHGRALPEVGRRPDKQAARRALGIDLAVIRHKVLVFLGALASRTPRRPGSGKDSGDRGGKEYGVHNHRPADHQGRRPSQSHGALHFTADVVLPGTLWGRALRSPLPHARILHIDTSRARQVPGIQGHSVFDFNTDESQCLCRLRRQPAACGGNVGIARHPSPIVVLRNAAITCGMLPQRTCERSS